MDQYENEKTIYYPSEGRITEIRIEENLPEYNSSREIYMERNREFQRLDSISKSLESIF